MADKNEITVMTDNTANTSLMLITKAEIDVQISTAKAFPRVLSDFITRAKGMATITEDVAASCNYSIPRSGKTIEGPSVRLAEIVCATYGNIRAGARVIDNDGKVITAQGICHDLETNYCSTIEVKRKITDRNGKTLSEDMQVVIGNAACAIAYRNAVFKVVPSALIEPVYEEALKVAKGNAQTLSNRRNKAIEYFVGLGVKQENIFAVLEVKKVEDIDLDKLQVLNGMRTAYKNEGVSLKELFEPKQDEKVTLEQLQELFNRRGNLLEDEDKFNIKRIIDDKEEKNYAKAFKMLSE